MCEIQVQIACPHCQGLKVVKNGIKKTGKPNFLCRQCGRQFQHQYYYRGADPAIKALIARMLVRNGGVRDCAYILEISFSTVLSCLQSFSLHLAYQPKQEQYAQVPSDEFWTYLGSKKQKLWLIYAYCPQTDQILAVQWGRRDQKTVAKLYQQIQHLTIDCFCSDDWKAFKAVLPADKHQVGKAYTKQIEGVNTCLRARNRRCVRRTTCFSKKKENHIRLMNQIILNRNLRHTV